MSDTQHTASDAEMAAYKAMGARAAFTAEAAFYQGLNHDLFVSDGQWSELLSHAADVRNSRGLRPMPDALTWESHHAQHADDCWRGRPLLPYTLDESGSPPLLSCLRCGQYVEPKETPS